jgi:hypothetical protein
LGHAAGLTVAAFVLAQRDAILSNRMLLSSPNPVAPLVNELSDALRIALVAAANAVKDEMAAAVAGVESSPDWQRLGPSDREAVLRASGLSAVVVPVVATDEELLGALDATSLSAWSERRQAIPAKAAQARAAAAKKLEPKAVTVAAPAATLRTEKEVDAYLAELKTRLLEHINNGETIII